MKSQLAKYQITEPMCDSELYAMKRKGWITEGTLVVTRKQRESLSVSEYEAVMAIGERLYGHKGR